MSRQEMKDEQFIKFQDEFYNLLEKYGVDKITAEHPRFDNICQTRNTVAELIEEEVFTQNREEEEQGTIYTGDAPSTEASFYKKTFVGVSETDYKKDRVNGATVIDLVIDLLKNGKVQQAIWELQDHLTTVQTEDLDNQAYSEGEGYR